MTAIEMSICVAVLAQLSAKGNPKFNDETHKAVAENICAAANKEGTDPRILAAYILTENRRFDPFSDRPASVGRDRGLYQSNSHFHGNRPNYQLVHHPYYGTEIASAIIRENLAMYGRTWQGIAAYWNPTKAKRKEESAKQYYYRWNENFNAVALKFELARNLKIKESQ